MLGSRLTAGQRTLNPSIGVRIPAPQPIRPHSLVVRTPASQAGDMGSIPIGAIRIYNEGREDEGEIDNLPQ